MAIRPYTFSVGEYYHVYNRGTEKRAIFLDRFDRARFLILLYICNNRDSILSREIIEDRPFETERGKPLVDIGAYCLMGNHFHLLLHEKVENGISTFMQKLSTAYAMYFNRKRERTGGLFEGKFKAKHSADDDYLRYLFAYIHLNPVEHIEPTWKERGIKNMKRVETYLANYVHSSYPDYIGVQRSEGVILNRNAFPDYFSKKNSFRSFAESWLELKPYHEEMFPSDDKQIQPIDF